MYTLTLNNGQQYDCLFAGKTENETAVFVIGNTTMTDAVVVFVNKDNTERIVYRNNDDSANGTEHVFEGYTSLVYCSNEGQNVRLALRKETA